MILWDPFNSRQSKILFWFGFVVQHITVLAQLLYGVPL